MPGGEVGPLGVGGPLPPEVPVPGPAEFSEAVPRIRPTGWFALMHCGVRSMKAPWSSTIPEKPAVLVSTWCRVTRQPASSSGQRVREELRERLVRSASVEQCKHRMRC